MKADIMWCWWFESSSREQTALINCRRFSEKTLVNACYFRSDLTQTNTRRSQIKCIILVHLNYLVRKYCGGPHEIPRLAGMSPRDVMQSIIHYDTCTLRRDITWKTISSQTHRITFPFYLECWQRWRTDKQLPDLDLVHIQRLKKQKNTYIVSSSSIPNIFRAQGSPFTVEQLAANEKAIESSADSNK